MLIFVQHVIDRIERPPRLLRTRAAAGEPSARRG
jgi:hypothetical protein